MRITIITEYFPSSAKVDIRGGVEGRCFYLGRELAKRHEVTVITSFSEGARREETIARMRVLRVGPHHPYTHKGAVMSRLLFAKAAEKAASRVPADIIDGTNFISYLPAFAASRMLDIPAIATYHEVWVGSWIKNKGIVTGSLGSIWERIVLTKPWEHFIAVSEFTKERLIDQGIRSKEVAVIPNGVDLSFYKGEVKKAKKPTICCISRLTPQKRVDDLIDAFYIVKKELPDAQCIIIGVGDEEARLRRIAANLGLGDSVRFLGFVKEHRKVIEHLKASHVLCLPSIMEGFGMVILEAMASGVPYVCTDIPPLKEVTDGGRGGLLCKQKDRSDLADKLLALLKDKRLYAKKAAEGLRHSKAFDWKNIARKVEDTYKEALHEDTRHH